MDHFTFDPRLDGIGGGRGPHTFFRTGPPHLLIRPCYWAACTSVYDVNLMHAKDKREIPNKWKKRSERRKHCALAVVRRSQKFSPHRRPLPGGSGRPKFNQLEMVTTFTYRPSLVEDRCKQFRVIVVTDPQTHTHTQTHAARPSQTGPITIHCAAKLNAQCN